MHVTLGDPLFHQIHFPTGWFSSVEDTLRKCSPHLRSCVLKTWIGGWTTSFRMHEPVSMRCLFGCKDEDDSLHHYLHCAPLWLLAGEALRCSVPFQIAKRLCVDDPSPQQVQLLSLCFQGYHYAKSLCEGEGEDRAPVQNSQVMQSAVQHAMKSFASSFCLQ